MLCIK